VDTASRLTHAGLRASFVGHTAGYRDRRVAGHSEGAVNQRDQIVRATPLRRLATPRDVAWTVVWLASRASSYLTGEVIDLDGGAHWPTFPHDVPDVGRPI
jgi:NAD(P)-dependent dehydrogenase (short-subunit alcohol dehydrogenase family)